MKTTGPLWKALNGVLMLGMILIPAKMGPGAAQVSPRCSTRAVRLTLASEQITFCAPTSLPFTTVEDNLTIPQVGYAGLTQLQGYATFNIRAAQPGVQPGPGMPVYSAGQVEEYRQAVRLLAGSEASRPVAAAPTASLWGEKVPGIQVEYRQSTSQGDVSLNSLEWDVEHQGRLWVFILTWDTQSANAASWQFFSEHMDIQSADGSLLDTAIDLGQAFRSTPPGIGRGDFSGGPVDVGLPAWWGGDICDAGNYLEATGKSAVPLGSPWHGVYACGTNPLSAMVNLMVQFYPGAWGQVEWQCVELANRFLYMEWGIPPVHGNAKQLKDNLPASMVFLANDGTHPIVPGDILIDDGKTASDSGHAMVIKGTHYDIHGEEYVDILEQNSSSAGSRSIHITNGVVDNDSWAWGRPVQGWLHVKANTASGDPDPVFTLTGVGLNGPVTALGQQSEDKVIIGGEFTGYDTTSRNHLARLNADGTLDAAFDTSIGLEKAGGTVQVNAIKIQSDDRILVGGYFDTYNSTARVSFARLNADGTMDDTFNHSTTGMTRTDVSLGDVPGVVEAIAIQPSDGMILVGGDFDKYNGASHHDLARLSATDGSVDAAFNPDPGGKVYALAVQADGKILVAGDFPHGILRLNSNGTVDPAFNPAPAAGANLIVNSIALQDDRIYIAGNFTAYNGASRSGVARLTSSGALDTTFNPGTGIGGTAPYLKTVLPQPDGRILIAGNFATYNATSAFNFLRLNNDGTRDTTFLARGDFSSTDVSKYVRPVLLQGDGRIVLGGQFSGYVIRLLNEIEPCYSLATQVNPSAPVSGGSVTVGSLPNCPGGKYISGSSVQLTAVPNTAKEFIFMNWSGSATGSSNPLTLMMTGDKTVTANFLDPPHSFNKIAPAKDATGVPLVVTFSWEPSSGAASYQFCLDANDSGVCDNDDTPSAWHSVGANTSVTIIVPLPTHQYSWNVRARNQADTTHGGTAWSFSRDDSVPFQIYLPMIIR